MFLEPRDGLGGRVYDISRARPQRRSLVLNVRSADRVARSIGDERSRLETDLPYRS
jgi:hypothetical protein